MRVIIAQKSLHRIIHVILLLMLVGLVQPVTAQQKNGIPTSVDWNKADNQIAIGYQNGTVKIMDAATGKITQDFKYDGSIQVIRWNPVSQQLAGLSNVDTEDTRLWVLDVNAGNRLIGLKGSFSVGGLDWNRDGSQLATTLFIGMGSSNSVQVWDVSSNQFAPNEGASFDKYPYHFSSIDWNPVNNRWIALAQPEDGLLGIWDLQTNRLVSEIRVPLYNEDTYLRSISWSPSGDKLATLDDLTTVNIWGWDGQQLTLADSFDNTNSATLGIGTIRWSPDGSKLAVIQSQSVKIMDAQTGREIMVTLPMAFLNDAAWSPDSQQVIYVGRQDNNDLNSGAIHLFTIPAEATAETRVIPKSS